MGRWTLAQPTWSCDGAYRGAETPQIQELGALSWPRTAGSVWLNDSECTMITWGSQRGGRGGLKKGCWALCEPNWKRNGRVGV